jgi:transposase InsO family protein
MGLNDQLTSACLEQTKENRITNVMDERMKRSDNRSANYSKCFVGKEESSYQWCVDSGATHHMCADKYCFLELSETLQQGRITTANGGQMKVCGKGKVRLMIRDGNTVTTVELSEVLWVPELECPLISVHKLVSDGKIVEFRNNRCQLRCEGETMNIATFDGTMYRLNVTEQQSKMTGNAAKAEKELCVHEWHRKMAHRNLNAIRMMKNEGIKIRPCDCSDICEACVVGKISRQPFPTLATPTENVLDVIVSDVCGYMQESSLGGSKYFITFIDAHSGFVKVEFLPTKGHAAQATIDYIEWLKTQLRKKPKIFRSDRGREYINEKLQTYLKREGIQRQCTVGYAPEQNGIAERMNRTLVEAARTMMTAAGLPVTLWAEAVYTAVYVFNRMINVKTKKTPYELLFGKKARAVNFHEFGSEAYVMIPYEKRQKLDDKAEKKIFVGYDEEAKGYRFINKDFGGKNRVAVTVSREVVFLDNLKENKSKQQPHEVKSHQEQSHHRKLYLRQSQHDQMQSDHEELFASESEEEDSGDKFTVVDELPVVEESDDEDFEDAVDENFDIRAAEEIVFGADEEADSIVTENVESEEEAVQEEESRRPQRSTKGNKPERLTYRAFNEMDSQEPKSYEEAMNSKCANEWKQAMNEELKSIIENDTWELTELPKGRKAIGSKWIFKNKVDENGIIIRRKARLVAQGYSQKSGVDYDEVFAPVARSTTLRMLLSISGERNYSVQHYDVTTAFLNGELEEELYLKQPPGFNNGHKVYKLKKSLYGLKQAARVWNKTLNDALTTNGCKQNETDKCLYVKRENERVMYVLIHVDDILVASNDKNLVERTMKKIGECFEIKNLGEAKHYLGLSIERKNGNFMISQQQYIDEIVKEANLTEAKLSKFPLDTGYYKQEGNLLTSNSEYRKLIGMLLYLTINTRPDIAASVSILSKRVEQPRDIDMNEVKRVIRYLKGTRDFKLKLNCAHQGGELHAYSDSDWAEDRIDRKSNTGYCCGINGGTISWCSRKQSVTALSSCEAEYIALTETCKEVVWLIQVARGLDVNITTPIIIHTDSQSCMAMIQNEKFSGRTKHIDVRYNYIRDQVRDGQIKLKYVPTEFNTADLMTKPLGKIKTEALRKLAGLHEE